MTCTVCVPTPQEKRKPETASKVVSDVDDAVQEMQPDNDADASTAAFSSAAPTIATATARSARIVI